MKSENTFWLLVFAGVLIARRPARVGLILPEVPQLYECNDGTFTTTAGPRGCVRHGGKKSSEVVTFGGSALIQIQDIPLGQIKTDTKLFQGREKPFSERSVENIVNDAQSGHFIWENLDPVTLWKSQEGVLYLLSGHSREEAFKRLSKLGVKVRGKSFDRIPAKIIVGMPLETARRVALESNTLSTKETDVERAAYYRKLRQGGRTEKDLLSMVRKNEGKNWVNIYAYTFLNPDGRTWATIRQFNESEDTSATLARSLAKWIGQARRTYPLLTNQHENELFDWLFNQRGYGTGPGKVSNEREFMDKVATLVNKNTFFGAFNADLPLNILNALLKSPAEAALDEQITELQLAIQKKETEIKAKIKEIAARNGTRDDLQRIITPMQAEVTAKRAALAKLMLRRTEVEQYSRNEVQLFGIGSPRNLRRRLQKVVV